MIRRYILFDINDDPWRTYPRHWLRLGELHDGLVVVDRLCVCHRTISGWVAHKKL